MYSFPYLEPICRSMSSSNCYFLPAYRYLRRQVRWPAIPISLRIFQFAMIHTVKGFGRVNKAKVDIFLELLCFFDDSMNFGHFISGSSAFSKSSLNTWKLTIQALLKPGLVNFEHFFTIVWDECNSAVAWAFFGSRVSLRETNISSIPLFNNLIAFPSFNKFRVFT